MAPFLFISALVVLLEPVDEADHLLGGGWVMSRALTALDYWRLLSQARMSGSCSS